MAKKKQIRNVLCFLVMIVILILMCAMPVSTFAVNDGDNTTGVSNPLNELENTFTEKSPNSGDCAPAPDADLPEIDLNDTPECVLSNDSGNDTNIIILTDVSDGTRETVSALGCDVYVKIDDPCCVGYRVYVDGAYKFTEGGDGTTPDGFCAFHVCAGTHTIKITKNGRSASKTKNFQCGYTYRWTSMPNCWCEDGGGSDDCKYPPTVKFDKTKYYEGDTVHATVSTSQSSVNYKIKDCGGTVRKSGTTSNGKKISYTIPKGASECCYWQICFYWDEGGPIVAAGAGGKVTALSYDCTKCYNFYVCPVQTCDVYVKIEDPCCVGYKVYVDGVYQFTEGGDGTPPDGYCAFHVKEGTHTLKISKNGRSASKTINFECNIVYRWVSMPKNWCGDGEAYVEIKDKYCKGYEVYVDGKYKLTEGQSGTPNGNCGFFVGEGKHTIEIRKNGRSASLTKYFDCNYRYTWDSMPDNWCNPCADPPTVKFDKPKYNEGDSLHATVSTSSGSVNYKIKDCSGTVRKSGDISNGGAIIYTIPKGTSKNCCNWQICFYWGEYTPPIAAAGAGSEVIALSYDCTRCYTFEVCPICTANVKIDDDTCVGYNVYVDDVYQLTEGVGETPDGYCTFDVTEGVHSIEIRDNECFASIRRYFECDSTYLWATMSDNWCKCKNCPSEVRFEGTAKTDELAGLVCYKTYYCKVIVDQILYDPDNTLQVGNEYTVGYGNDPKNITAGDKIVVNGTYYHNCGPFGAYGRICGDLWKDLPDLIIEDIKLPSRTVCLGDRIPITLTVKNIGGEKANQSVVKYYVDNKYIDLDAVPSLVPNATSNQTFNWTANSCGNISVMAIADANHTVHECNESNNAKQKRIEASGPDLITHIWSAGPAGTVCLGEQITFTVTVVNIGDCTAGQSVVIYYADNEYIDSDLIPSLSPGATSTQTFTWTASSCGNVSVRAVADANNEVRECDENNNDKAKTVRVDGPDLIIQDIIVPTGKICLDQPVRMTVTVKNQGGCTADASVVKYYVDNQYVDSDSIPSLSPGASSTQTFTWTASSCGDVPVKAVADANNDVKECDENNNDKQKSIEVDGPDLIIQDITWPSGKICLDEPVTITVTVKNQGGCTADASTVKYFVDNKYVDSDSIPSLDPGAASTQTFTWTADSCGNVSVKGVADANNEVHECDENNNENQKSIEVDGPDLIIQDITWPSGIICLDHEISIEVTTANVGKCDAEKPFKVKLYVQNKEVGNATINFLGAGDQENTTFSWIPDTCGILSIKAVADVDNTIHECDENNNEKQKSIEVDGPDLIIQDITWPSGIICLDKEIEIEVTTANVGKCPAEMPFKVTLYVQNIEVGNVTIDFLDANATETPSITWMPDTCGILSIKAVADVDNTIHECDKDNNEKSKSIEVDGPDLIIQDITWPSGIICLDHEINIEVTTANVGKCPAETPFKVSLYVENIEVGNVTIDSLDANATKTPSITWKPDTCGVLGIKAVADVDNTIHECDENNNEKQKSIEVDGPDLIIQDISWPSGIICLDHEISIEVTTANVGKCDAETPFTVSLYVENIEVGNVIIDSLDANATKTPSITWKPDTCGILSIKAVADVDNTIHECDENNNEKQKSIEVDGPDLIVKEISPASEFIIGVKTDITVVVKNQGRCASGTSTIEYYDGSTRITSDTVSPLAKDGGEEKKTFAWTPTSCGIHTIKVVADAENAVHECDENNNQKSKSVEVKGPDLVVDQISVSSPTTIGSTIKFTVVVKNKGTAAAGKSSYLQCYIDGSALGSKLSVPILASGQSSTHDVSWTASGCGPHTFKAVADVDLNVIECNENNNDKQTSFRVKCPDLIIESITPSPGSPAPNQQVTFSVVVKNKGDADAGDSTLKCFVGSTAICTESAGSIPAGKTSTRSCTWTGSGCAEHNFKAAADSVGNRVTESNEGNNEKTRSFSVVDTVKPSITITSPSNGYTSSSSSITVKGSASDNAGVTKVEVKVNSGSWQQASGTTSWSTSVSLSEGANTITAKATDICGNERSTSITVHYKPSPPSNPDFTISVSPSSRTISPGDSATYTVSLTAVEGFSSPVSLSVSGQPSGATASFDSTSVTPTGSTTLTIDTPTTTSEGAYTVTVTGTGGGKTHQAKAKLVISSEALSDLVITDIWWEPENPKPGEGVTFYHTVSNVGNADASDFGDALDIDGEGWDITARGSLAAGKSKERFSTHLWKAEAGHHIIKVEADWEDCISESDKTNNVLIKELIVEEPLPDLVITDIWWEPENPKHGDEVTFYHTVTNQGNADASDFGDALDIDGEGWDITARSSLAAGKSVERFSTHVWIASTGTHTIKVEADWEDCISESDKTNNVLTKELVISTIELIPSSHDFGEVPYLCSRGFSFTLKNAGSETATGTVCLTGDDADQFRIDSESDDFSLIAGEAMAIDVVFYPTSTGTKSAILRANDCQSTLMGMGVGYDWTEESHAWVKCIPWEVEDISEYTDEALNHLVSAGISEWIRHALKLSAKGGLPISVAVGVYMQMGLAGYPAEIENTFIERGEEVEMDNMQVSHRYLAWFMVDPGVEQFVIGTATLQSYWRYEWIDVGTYEVLSQEEASKYNCNTFIWIVPKEPFVFSEKGRYRFLFTTPWGFSRSGNNGFEVFADSWSPFLEDYKVSNDPSTHISLKFSEDVEKSTVDGSTITVVGSASGVHSCSFKFDNPNYDVELIPTDRFSNGETVEVTIGAGVTDLCGNAFTTPNNFVFTIG